MWCMIALASRELWHMHATFNEFAACKAQDRDCHGEALSHECA